MVTIDVIDNYPQEEGSGWIVIHGEVDKPLPS